MFGTLINYYNPGTDLALRHSALLCAALAMRVSEVSSVVIVDGSPYADDVVAQFCGANGSRYLHAGRELNFAQGYNLGLTEISEDWVCLMASDVYVAKDTFARITRLLDALDVDRVGAVIPYLSVSDLPWQARVGAGPAYISPLMTLNLNVFPAHVLRQIGGVPEDFSGCFNDVLMSKRLFDLGKLIYLADAYATHFGRMTTDVSTRVIYADDAARFAERYPDLFEPLCPLWNVDLSQFTNNPQVAHSYKMALAMPDGARQTTFKGMVEQGTFLVPLETTRAGSFVNTDALARVLESKERQLARVQARLRQREASLSWRITKPLRSVRSWYDRYVA